MLGRGIPSLSDVADEEKAGAWPSGIRMVTVLGIAVGVLDVITTAEHVLVPPLSDGNPLLMAIGAVSPLLAYVAFVCWFLLVAGVAITRDDGFGYGADVYLFAAFGLGGVANAAYFLSGTLFFKRLVGQFPTASNLYILVFAPLGSLLAGVCWVRLRT